MELSYFNARIRGLRGRLIVRAAYEPLFKIETVGQYLDKLRATAYGPYIEAAGARFEKPEDVLNAALFSSLADSFAFIWHVAPKDARDLLKSVLSAWEVYDIKAILRGVARGIKRDEVMGSVIPAGEFDEASVKTLLGARDVVDLVRFLDTWGSAYAAPVKAGLPRFRKDHAIMDIEIKIDIHIFGHLLGSLRNTADEEMIKDILALRIDQQNIMTLIKVAGEGYSKEGLTEFFIEGGTRIRLRGFLTLSEIKEREPLIKAIAGKLRENDFREALSTVGPEEMALLEERFDEIIEARLKRLAIIEPLSIALGASFIYAKVREIKNLRLLSRAKSFGMPEDEARRLVIYPH